MAGSIPTAKNINNTVKLFLSVKLQFSNGSKKYINLRSGPI